MSATVAAPAAPRVFAHIVAGVVSEIYTVPAVHAAVPLAQLFATGAHWEGVTTSGVAVGWTFTNGVFAPPVPPAQTVASASAALAVLLALKETAGISFTASGATAASVFATDTSAQGKLVSAFVMAQAGLWVDGTPWIDTSGVGVPMIKADVMALAAKAAGYVAACSTHYAGLLAEVRVTPGTDITAGWPSNT